VVRSGQPEYVPLSRPQQTDEATMRKQYALPAALATGILLWQLSVPGAASRAAASDATVKQLFDKDLIGVPGKELVMLTVEYLPGGASLPHRHDAQVFVYVLEGELTMQVAGSPAVNLKPGQTFYENPTDVHTVSANASKTAPAKILVFIVKDKGKPVTRSAELPPTS
jgi:quercetin dioxygenase-like cupin family protein